MKITQKSAAALPIPERDTWHFDDQLKGFAVRCRPDGSAAYWVRFRLPDGTQRKKNLGPVKTTKAEAARERARDLIEAARHGKDIVGDLRAIKAAPTIADLAERHLAEHKPPHIAPGHWENNKRCWRLHILPEFGSTKVNAISDSQVKRLFEKASQLSQPKANAIIRCLSKALNDAEGWGWRSGKNPCSAVKKHRLPPRQELLEPEQVAHLIAVCQEFKKQWPPSADPGRYGAPWAGPYLVELLLMTGLRLREWSCARWDWADLKAGTLSLPKTKTGARLIHLPDQAVALLASMPRFNKWIIPNYKGTGPMQWPEHVWQLIRSRAGLDHIRLHDLRHTFASYAHMNAGMSLREVGAILGHSDARMTERYVNVSDRRLKEAANRGATAMAELFTSASSHPEGSAQLGADGSQDNQ